MMVPGSRAPQTGRPFSPAHYLIPPVLTLLLVVPCLRLGFAWDDFDFLARAQRFAPADLMPSPQLLFYRPLSREVFFRYVALLGPERTLFAHLTSAALLAATVFLLALLTEKCVGRRTGFMAGLMLASLGAAPTLVAWTSGIQDLLAMLFVLIALLLRVRGSTIGSAIAFAAALLAKETSVTALPALLLVAYLFKGRPLRVRDSAPLLTVTALWAAFHPGLRILLSRSFLSGTHGYIGVDNSGGMVFLFRGVLTLMNLPTTFSGIASTQVLLGFLAAVAVAAALSRFRERPAAPSELGRPSRIRLLIFSVLLGLPPLLLTSGLVKHWAPYYSCFPALGATIGFATLVDPLEHRWRALVMAAYLGMGIIWRAVPSESGIISEPSLYQVHESLRQVERRFKQLDSRFPPNAIAYVSVGAVGPGSVYAHIHRFQALRIWYWEPTLATLRPEEHRRGGPEFLFRITPDLRVVEIRPEEHRYRSPGGKIPYAEYQRTVRTYARGLAASGGASRAADILLHMPERDSLAAVYDRRMAAMLLLAGGQNERAQEILDRTPAMPREPALNALARMLTATDLKSFDVSYALVAFDFRPDDQDALRALMSSLYRGRYFLQANALANRLLQIDPNDAGAIGVRKRIAAIPALDLTELPVDSQ